MSAAPLVTICVPTFDRAQHVERLLRSLAAEIGAREDVLVLVSDNASPDRTPEVLAAAQARHPWLRVHRQAKNMGPVGNLRWLAAHAPASEHLWFFGDDDLLAPGAIAAVVALLRAERPAWLWLPHQFLNASGGVAWSSPVPPAPERFATSADLYRAHHHWLTFISASVVRAEPLREAVAAVQVDTPWAPLLWYFRAGADGPCVAAHEPLVLGSDDISWSDRRHLYLTLRFCELWDQGLHAGLTEQEFARTLDGLYTGEWALELWRRLPLEELAARVRRFRESEVLREYLWVLARERDDREALAALEDPEREEAARELVAAGEAQFAAGRLHEAVAAFRRAVRLAPTLTEAWNDLAVGLHAVGHRIAAAEAIACALFASPDDPDALANRAALEGELAA